MGDSAGSSTPASRSTVAERVPNERRRFPRRVVSDTAASLPLVLPTEVLDISRTGALVRCDCTLDVGGRARLDTLLDGAPFAAWVAVVRVRRDRSSPGTDGTRVGLVFTALDDAADAMIHRFLKG